MRSNALPAAGLAAQLLPAGVFPVVGLAERGEAAAGLPAREASEVFPARAPPAADLPGQVLPATGLPARAPLAGFAPAARAGRRSGDTGMEMRTFREYIWNYKCIEGHPRTGDPQWKDVRRRPTLPRGGPRSTIGAERLSFRVRNGTGRFPLAMTAVTLLRCQSNYRPYPGNCTVDA